MASTKDIQRRIKSIANTKKITRAMEMVAAAKMRKAVEAVLRTRSYANLSWSTVLNLSAAARDTNGGLHHPLLTPENNGGKVAMVLLTANRGLCGGYNTAVMGKARHSILKHEAKEGIKTDFILMGKKGRAVRRYWGYDITAEFEKPDVSTSSLDIRPLARMVIDGFRNGEYGKVMVAYTDFVSAAKQQPRVKQLLPVDITAEDDSLGVVGADSRLGSTPGYLAIKQDKYLSDDKYVYEYTFEPSPAAVLDAMIPRLIEIQLFQALLEANASEHSARMNAMHQANEAAGDMISELTLSFNKARQAAITREIAEISAGANALAE